MNGKIRPGGGPQTVPGLHLSTRLPGLVQRLRGPEIDQLASVLDPDNPSQIAEAGRLHQSEVKRLQREHDRLKKEIEEATTPQALKRLVLQRTASPEFSELKGAPSALNRWLDPDALLECLQAQIDQHGILLELCARLLGGLQLSTPALRFLQSLLDSARLPTRRQAARSLAEWCVVRQSAGQMDTLLAEELLKAGLRKAEDPLTARACLLVLSVLGPAGDSALDTLLPESTDRAYPAIVRCQAVRMALLGGASRQDWTWNRARLDPSEQVRSALADALSTEGSPISIERLTSLSKRDPSSAVRKRALRLLDDRALPGSHQETFETSAEMGALVADCADLQCGESLTAILPDSESPMDLAVALLESVEDGFGFALAPTMDGRLCVTRGDRKVLRFWRLFHEVRHPAPGKRLLGDHVSGRARKGPVRVEGDVLSERFPTGVPNQPHHINDSVGSAPWLPLPEAALEAADWGSIVVVTSKGVTSLHAPQGTLSRVWAQIRISTRMPQLMQRRMQALQADTPLEKQQYVRELEGLGFRTAFTPHPEQVAPSGGIDQYFGVTALPALSQATSPGDLTLVASAVGAYSLYRLRQRRQVVAKTRAAIPLSIGNWGTRGKSSVTRLQAALFEGLGYTVLAKTTGSEASLFLAGQGKEARRLPIYRPMNKVSILEHHRAIREAQELGAQVFVWECMALRPEYVDQVQHHWTQDDLSTITNAHADHEDVQGPTGRDVAEVIAAFLPEGSLAVSTEQAMRPIFEDAAARRNTALKTLSMSEIQSIPSDLLEGFEHQEHPANLALALQVAEELGCDREEAGYLMAQHTLADLGALRVTPPMRAVGRRVSLSNGMSANQPAGLLSNWSSCGFFESDPLGHPNHYYLSVVNNRQDRPQRSRAFAQCIARSLPAHRHVLIGSNLPGFLRQIREELEAQLDEWTALDSPKAMEQRLRGLRRQIGLTSPGPLLRSTALSLGLRSSQMANLAEELDNRIAQVDPQPLTYRQAREQLRPLQESFNQLAHQIEGALFHNSRERRVVIEDAKTQWLDCAAEALMFSSVAKACAQSHSPEQRLSMLKSAYTELFLRHILILPGQPSADQVLQFAARSCPPGVEIQAMAVQNIQGPGRALAAAIQSSCRVFGLTEQLSTGDGPSRAGALQELRAPHQWTVPLCQEALRAIYGMPADPRLAGERDLTVNHIHQILETCERSLHQGPKLGGLLSGIHRFATDMGLPLRVIRNRRRADRVLEDLCKGLISRERAERVLAAIVEDEERSAYSRDPDSPMLG